MKCARWKHIRYIRIFGAFCPNTPNWQTGQPTQLAQTTRVPKQISSELYVFNGRTPMAAATPQARAPGPSTVPEDRGTRIRGAHWWQAWWATSKARIEGELRWRHRRRRRSRRGRTLAAAEDQQPTANSTCPAGTPQGCGPCKAFERQRCRRRQRSRTGRGQVEDR